MKSADIRIKVVLGLVLLLSLVVRIDYDCWEGIVVMNDTESYLRVADAILLQGRFLDPERTPGYPLFLVMSYVLFGYREFIPVVIMQSLLGLASVLLVYVITLRLTGKRVVSLVSAFLISCNYQLINHEPRITTEMLSLFMVLATVYVMVRAIQGRFQWYWAVLVNVCFVLLVFTKPFLLVSLPIVPIVAVMHYLKERERAKVLNLMIPWVLVVIVPIGLWCGAIKRNYGFLGISKVSSINILGAVVRTEQYQYAPEQYQEFVGALEHEREQLQGSDSYNPHLLVERLAGHIPQKSEADYSYLTEFGMASIRGAPWHFLRRSLSQLPLAFTKIEKVDEYRDRRTVIARLGGGIYKYSIYKAYRNSIWVVVLLFSLLAPVVVYKRDFQQGLGVLVIALLIWVPMVSLQFLTYAEYARLRMPVDPLIVIMLCVGFYELIYLGVARSVARIRTLSSQGATQP